MSSLQVGDAIPDYVVEISRDTLVRYAGASGDFNPIHYSDQVATSVGLPGVIAHGMLTMGAVIEAVVGYLGDPGAVLEYAVRFAKPIPVPAIGSAQVAVSGKVTAADDGKATIVLTVRHGEVKVLGKAQVVVRTA